MISYLEGKVIEKNVDYLVVLVGGLGFEVRAPAGTIEKAPAVGGNVSLFTYLHVRQDVLQLYGFGSTRARGLFIKLMSVSGFGAAKALSVLSIFSPEGFGDIIARGDADALTMIPGVGKKSAQRLLLEMRDKIELAFEEVGMPEGLRASRREAVEALVQLGYSRGEAHDALKKYPADDGEAGVEEMLQFALKNINR
ncbi:MAG: Holliday junction branch migration protein RuvA [Actinobacteria bacterium]|nr:Holliday junction branch migration protein RuvA [Actinomycetota bacterium]MCG2795564.1 Holliday junction branch migration protein RuvA [Actinomycetes bacterium]MBU4240734.1 Holliday junction branch migration protein RuvA [Actinomycetota bacterium]MBU4302631.1 Holliday junction branch migration protein RuvA [Actinomycetota bacterium]MBU4385666.1 Holliday junction branch migration protein RuvA [Actinomycetota bacterium]